jgi:predicted RNA binding protein YcfA (HicA-like mRNA interferase family)
MGERELEKRLRDSGFDLVRQKKHRVYKNPAGHTFVTSSTPSDHRWSDNALRQLERLCGPVTEDSRPLRARRRHRRLKPLVPDPAPTIATIQEEPTPAPQSLPVVAPLSKADQKKLKRWEKHAAQRAVKIERRVVELRRLAEKGYQRFMTYWYPDRVEFFFDCLWDLRWLTKKYMGINDSSLVIADVSDGSVALYVRADKWIIDIFDGELREAPWKWTEKNGQTSVEVWGEIKPEDFPGLKGTPMYQGYVTAELREQVARIKARLEKNGVESYYEDDDEDDDDWDEDDYDEDDDSGDDDEDEE